MSAETWRDRIERLNPAQRARLAATLARERAPIGPSGAEPVTQLVAYVVAAHAGETPLAAGLREHVAARLPSYMVPSRVIQLESLPRLPNGKVDRQRLPDPGSVAEEDSRAYVAPRTEAERVLADIWSRVLGVDQVGIHDDFFELGGDSLLSIQIVAKARQAGIALRPAMLLELPTIAQLTRAVAPLQPAETSIDIADAPASPIQRWLLEQPLAHRSHWNQTLAVRCRRRLDPAMLRAATDAVLAHHAALRSRFFVEEGEWRWSWDSAPAQACVHRELDTATDAETAAAIQADAPRWHRSFDISAGDVFRVVQYDDATTSWLLIVAHHLVMDVISQTVLLDDLMTAYRQMALTSRAQLPAPTASFAAWCHALAVRASRPDVRSESGYWALRASETGTSLPRDHRDGSNAFVHRRELIQTFEPAVTDRIVARFTSGRGLQDALCAALALVLSEWSGDSAVQIDVEGHGRSALADQLDASRTVGWFTTVHPVRLRLDPRAGQSPRFAQALAQLADVPGNGEGFGLLRFLGDDRALRDTLALADRAEVVLAYFGQRARITAADDDVEIVTMPVSLDRHGDDPRRYLLEVTGWLREGRLEIVWGYSSAVHEPRTIEQLARHFDQVLHDRAVDDPSAGPTIVTSGVELDQDDLAAITRALDLGSDGRP